MHILIVLILLGGIAGTVWVLIRAIDIGFGAPGPRSYIERNAREQIADEDDDFATASDRWPKGGPPA